MAEVKNERILMIVESPHKRDTIKKFLPPNYIVMASFGHICGIKNCGEYNMGIKVSDNSFEETYEISADKKDVVSKLKDQVKFADKVVLATDPDREGEAIAWFLRKFLNLKKGKYERVTYHEISKKAIEEALKHPRDIDENYCAAAQVRQDRDKIVGFTISNLSRKATGAKSVGNVQSPSVNLLVMRQNEIDNFVPELYFDLFLHFNKNQVPFKAKYQIPSKAEYDRIPSLDECKRIADECKGNDYIIESIKKKDGYENPKPPFITATFQQEVSKKLGISIEDAMKAAQELFDNGYITYHRTDDPVYSDEFITTVKAYVEEWYGKEYYAPLKAGKKSENAQEGHEGIRPVDVNMTPERLSKTVTNNRLLKVYEIIWKRAVSCGMKPAVYANTTYTIKNGNHTFIMNSKELKFDGFKRVYSYQEDAKDDDGIVKESFTEGEVLQDTELEGIEKHTNPPLQYDEAALIKELERLGIGRPSTYATIVSILKDTGRGFTTIQDKRFYPTELAMKQIKYLGDNFSQIIDINARAEQEKELDEIAKGNISKLDAMTTWWANLKSQIDRVDPTPKDDGQVRICPECGKNLVIRKGRYGVFLGCSGYPKCTHNEKLETK